MVVWLNDVSVAPGVNVTIRPGFRIRIPDGSEREKKLIWLWPIETQSINEGREVLV